MSQIIDVTQDLQRASNHESYRKTASKYQSSWLTDYTQTFAGSLEDLLSYVESLGLEATEQTYPISGRTHYSLNKAGTYAGHLEQAQKDYEKELTPNGWLAIILKN